jgi:hypothetical protein
MADDEQAGDWHDGRLEGKTYCDRQGAVSLLMARAACRRIHSNRMASDHDCAKDLGANAIRFFNQRCG